MHQACSTKLSTILTEPKGVRYLIAALEDQTSLEDWQKVQSIATIIGRCPKAKAQVPLEYYDVIFEEIHALLVELFLVVN